MTKVEVANVLRQRTGLTQKQALELVDVFLRSVKTALLSGKKVSLVGFGSFTLKVKPARAGRNPRTGAAIEVPEKTVVVFKPGRSFRDLVEAGPNGLAGATMAGEPTAMAAAARNHGETSGQML